MKGPNESNIKLWKGDMGTKAFVGGIVLVALIVTLVLNVIPLMNEQDTPPIPSAAKPTPYEAWVISSKQDVWYLDSCLDNIFYTFQVQCDAAKAIIESDMPVSTKTQYVRDFENCMSRIDIDECYADIWFRIMTR